MSIGLATLSSIPIFCMNIGAEDMSDTTEKQEFRTNLPHLKIRDDLEIIPPLRFAIPPKP